MDNRKESNRKDMKEYTILEDVKLRYIYYILLGIWGIDFISTIIALNFFTQFSEANLFQAYFFNLGWYGWFLSFSVTGCILFVLTLLIGFGGKLVKGFEEKKRRKGYYNIFIFYCAGVFSGLELTVIIHNIGLLLGTIH